MQTQEITIRGGGRGWTATAPDGTQFKREKKLLAIEAAEAHVRASDNPIVVSAPVNILDLAKADDHPAAKPPKRRAQAQAATGSTRACDLSCLFAHISTCVCQCEGTNHQTGWALFLAETGRDPEEMYGGPKRKEGGRVCACGCGQMTKGGRFLQGHDRRFHVSMAEKIDIDEHFRAEDGVGLVMKPATRRKLGR